MAAIAAASSGSRASRTLITPPSLLSPLSGDSLFACCRLMDIWNFKHPFLGRTFMREAVVVSYARTGMANSGRGGFNISPAVSIAAPRVKHAEEKSGVETPAVAEFFSGNGAHG